MKKLKLGDYFRLVNHGPVVLITSGRGKQVNAAPIAWNVPVSDEPPLFAIAVERGIYTHELIRKTKEFTVNVPVSGQLEAVKFCGKHSGRERNKIRDCGLVLQKGIKIKTPHVRGCAGFFECRVEKTVSAGGQDVFIGRVLSAYAAKDYFDGKTASPSGKTFHHLGRGVFVETGRKI